MSHWAVFTVLMTWADRKLCSWPLSLDPPHSGQAQVSLVTLLILMSHPGPEQITFSGLSDIWSLTGHSPSQAGHPHRNQNVSRSHCRLTVRRVLRKCISSYRISETRLARAACEGRSQGGCRR